MSTDAIVLLKEDHKQVKALFRRFEQLKEADGAGLAECIDEVCRLLTIHATLEEELFYPVARRTIDDEEQVLEAGEEHHVVTMLINELDSMSTTDEHFVAKCTVLKELVTHHADEEEEELFPMVREKLGRKELAEIGEKILARRDQLEQEIPTRARTEG